MQRFLKHSHKLARISGSVPEGVVVEVDVGVSARLETFLNGLSVSSEELSGIKLIVPSGTMTADVGKVRGSRKICNELGPISHAEAYSVCVAHIEHFPCYPASVPELKSASNGKEREEADKPFEPVEIDPERRGELPENDLKLLAKAERVIKKEVQGFFRLSEPLYVGDEPAALDGEYKVVWRLIVPPLEGECGR